MPSVLPVNPHQLLQAVDTLFAWKVSGYGIRPTHLPLQPCAELVDQVLTDYDDSKERLIEQLQSSPELQLLETLWLALPALDQYRTEVPADGIRTKPVEWERWKAWWPILWPHQSGYTDESQVETTAQSRFPNIEAFTGSGRAPEYNNFLFYFMPDCFVGSQYQTVPAFRRLQQTETSLVRSLEDFMQGEVGRAIRHHSAHPQKEEVVQLLFSAYHMMASYTDLYPEEDSWCFIR